MIGTVLDALGTVLIVIGVLLTLIASVGVLALPDVLSRMHAATKPQVLGLLLVQIGGALHLRSSVDVWMLVLVGAFQLVTAPVTAHVLGRLAHQGHGVRRELLHVDELDDDLAEHTATGPDDPGDPGDPDRSRRTDGRGDRTAGSTGSTDVPTPRRGSLDSEQ